MRVYFHDETKGEGRFYFRLSTRSLSKMRNQVHVSRQEAYSSMRKMQGTEASRNSELVYFFILGVTENLTEARGFYRQAAISRRVLLASNGLLNRLRDNQPSSECTPDTGQRRKVRYFSYSRNSTSGRRTPGIAARRYGVGNEADWVGGNTFKRRSEFVSRKADCRQRLVAPKMGLDRQVLKTQ